MSNIIEILNNIGYVDLSDSGQEWRCRPLYRNSDNKTSLSIRKSTGEWYDHSDGVGGGLALLIQKTLNLPSLKETSKYLSNLPFAVDTKNVIELADTKKFDKQLLERLSKDNSYWNSRGISNHTLSKFDGGIAKNGRMKGRYVFPIFNERTDLVGFSGRLVQKNDSLPKWKLIGSKKEWVFPMMPSTPIVEKKSAILVESIGDALSLIEVGVNNVLVLFGIKISPAVISYLLKTDVNSINILLNNDYDNNLVGNRASVEIKDTLSSYFDDHQINILTPTNNDLNEMLNINDTCLKDFCVENGLYK